MYDICACLLIPEPDWHKVLCQGPVGDGAKAVHHSHCLLPRRTHRSAVDGRLGHWRPSVSTALDLSFPVIPRPSFPGSAATVLRPSGRGDSCNSASMIWYDMIWYDMIWYDMIWYDMIWYDMIWYDMIWYDMILRCNVIWYDIMLQLSNY